MLKPMMTAEQLGIKRWELNALIKVRDMLINGELQYVKNLARLSRDFNGSGFNMGMASRELDCGAVRCIGGWMGHFKKIDESNYVEEDKSEALHDLFYPDLDFSWSSVLAGRRGGLNPYEKITTEQAVRAINNFLYDGEPRWIEVLSSS